MTSDARSPVRPPQQERSRAKWERALDVATTLVEEGGWEALSVAEVCRTAGISAPSLYARVDGLNGLFAAVYERQMALIGITEEHEFAQATTGPAATRVHTTVAAAAAVFDTHHAFLRAVIRRATADPALLERGAEESQRIISRIAQALPGQSHAREVAARSIYVECTFRAMYGDHFFTATPETIEGFIDRVTLVATGILRMASPIPHATRSHGEPD